MAVEYRLPYTALEVEDRLKKLDGLTANVQEQLNKKNVDYEGINLEDIPSLEVDSYVQLRDAITGEPIYPVSGASMGGGSDVEFSPIADSDIEEICTWDQDDDEESVGDVIPIASEVAIGCISVGDGLTVEADGKLSAVYSFLGENPIAAKSEDTLDKWLTLGNGVAYFSALRLNGQPQAQGFLINLIYNNIVYQMFHTLDGIVWYRNEITDKWTKSLSENNGIQKELLWTNPNTTLGFSEQNLIIKKNGQPIDLSQYSEIEIVFLNSQVEKKQVRITCEIGGKARAFMMTDWDYAGFLWGQSRDVEVQSDYIYFANAVKKSMDSKTVAIKDGTRMIPYKVYGIKGVQ